MNLHDRIRAVVEERLRIARAVAGYRQRPGELSWAQCDPEREHGLIGDALGNVVTYHEGSPSQEQAAHIVANDPADVILSAEHALWTLDEHKPRKTGPFGVLCEGCSVTEGSGVLRFVEYPCRSLLALATRWRVEVDG